MKKILIKFFAIIRGKLVYNLIRRFYRFRFVRKISRYFDPNYIRKKIEFEFVQDLDLIVWDKFGLFVDLNDHIGYRTYITGKPFEGAVYALARKLGLSSDDVILDIGANVGSASVPVCAELGCELVAIEASKENAIILLKNILFNKIRAHVSIVAVTSEESSGDFLKLHLRDGNRGANSILNDWNPSVGESNYELVPSVSLDQFITNSNYSDRIKIIKIDVEGAELDVVRGGMSFLKRNSAPILMEYRIDVNPVVNQNLAKVIEFLSESYFVYGFENGSKVDFDRFKSYENILFEKK